VEKGGANSKGSQLRTIQRIPQTVGSNRKNYGEGVFEGTQKHTGWKREKTQIQKEGFLGNCVSQVGKLACRSGLLVRGRRGRGGTKGNSFHIHGKGDIRCSKSVPQLSWGRKTASTRGPLPPKGSGHPLVSWFKQRKPRGEKKKKGGGNNGEKEESLGGRCVSLKYTPASEIEISKGGSTNRKVSLNQAKEKSQREDKGGKRQPTSAGASSTAKGNSFRGSFCSP